MAEDFAGRDASCLWVVTQLIAPSQREVGERWLRAECSVGDEHAATFVTESVLSSLAVGLEAGRPAGTLVMVCAEGEWRGLPARMATELLIAGGRSRAVRVRTGGVRTVRLRAVRRRLLPSPP